MPGQADAFYLDIDTVAEVEGVTCHPLRPVRRVRGRLQLPTGVPLSRIEDVSFLLADDVPDAAIIVSDRMYLPADLVGTDEVHEVPWRDIADAGVLVEKAAPRERWSAARQGGKFKLILMPGRPVRSRLTGAKAERLQRALEAGRGHPGNGDAMAAIADKATEADDAVLAVAAINAMKFGASEDTWRLAAQVYTLLCERRLWPAVDPKASARWAERLGEQRPRRDDDWFWSRAVAWLGMFFLALGDGDRAVETWNSVVKPDVVDEVIRQVAVDISEAGGRGAAAAVNWLIDLIERPVIRSQALAEVA